MQRLYQPDAAAAYLGMSRRSFDALVAPHLRYVLIGKTGKRYDRDDLDEWAGRQRKMPPASNCRRKPCKTESPEDSAFEAISGGSKKSFDAGICGSDFMSQLDAVRSRTPPSFSTAVQKKSIELGKP